MTQLQLVRNTYAVVTEKWERKDPNMLLIPSFACALMTYAYMNMFS